MVSDIQSEALLKLARVAFSEHGPLKGHLTNDRLIRLAAKVVLEATLLSKKLGVEPFLSADEVPKVRALSKKRSARGNLDLLGQVIGSSTAKNGWACVILRCKYCGRVDNTVPTYVENAQLSTLLTELLEGVTQQDLFQKFHACQDSVLGCPEIIGVRWCSAPEKKEK